MKDLSTRDHGLRHRTRDGRAALEIAARRRDRRVFFPALAEARPRNSRGLAAGALPVSSSGSHSKACRAQRQRRTGEASPQAFRRSVCECRAAQALDCRSETYGPRSADFNRDPCPRLRASLVAGGAMDQRVRPGHGPKDLRIRSDRSTDRDSIADVLTPNSGRRRAAARKRSHSTPGNFLLEPRGESNRATSQKLRPFETSTIAIQDEELPTGRSVLPHRDARSTREHFFDCCAAPGGKTLALGRPQSSSWQLWRRNFIPTGRGC